MLRLTSWRTLATGLALAASYYAVVHLGLGLGILYDGYAPFWPAAGLASGALSVLGLAYAPAIGLGSLAHTLSRYPLPASIYFMLVDAGEAVLVAALIRRFQIGARLDRPRDVVRFSLIAIAGGFFSASLSGPVYVRLQPSQIAFGGLLAGWTLGNAISHLVVCGTILAWSKPGPDEPRRASLLERTAIAAGTGAVSLWIFLAPHGAAPLRLYVVLALVTWIAVRLGQRAVGTTMLGISGLAAWAVTRGTGPFAPADGPALQAFLGVSGLAAFGVAAVAAEREQAATRREREERYRELADASPNLMWVSRGGGRIELVNAKVREYTGATELAENWVSFVHPDDRQRLLVTASASSDAVHPAAAEARIRRHDGAYRWHWIVVVPVAGTPGMGPRWIGTATDVHDRKLAEIELATWHAHYERAQTIGQLGSWESSLDTKRGTLVWSSELFRIFGIEPASFDGRIETFYAHVHPEDRAAVERAATAAIAGGPRYSIEHRIVRPDGEVRWVHQEGDITTALDGSRRMVGICRDITERVHAEEARRQLEVSLLQAQKLESLGILAGGIAHDFNNLLVGILGNASLALLDLPDDDSPAREAVQRIETSSQRAADLVRQMLAYSGRAAITLQRVDLSALVREMGELLATAISKKAVLHYDLAPHLPPIAADPTQIRQVVMNLITNASDALGDGAGVIAIRTALVAVTDQEGGAAGTSAAPGKYVQVSVSDTGVGMDEETAARIFDPFFSTKFTGRGLGLAAVQGIVRSHRGAVRLHTAPGQGTSFVVLLPVATGQAPRDDAEARPSGAAKLEGTVLVIDDEPAVREAMVRMLQRAGLTVLAADGGRTGLDMLARHREAVSAVVLDLTMPDMGGAEVLRVIRTSSPRLPVVVVSGYTRSDALEGLGVDGPQAFLQKPFRPQDLAQVLRSLLAGESGPAGTP